MHSNIILGYQSWASDDPDNGQYGPAFMSPSNNNYNWRDGDSGSHAHPICQITKSMAYLISKSIQLICSSYFLMYNINYNFLASSKPKQQIHDFLSIEQAQHQNI